MALINVKAFCTVTVKLVSKTYTSGWQRPHCNGGLHCTEGVHRSRSINQALQSQSWKSQNQQKWKVYWDNGKLFHTFSRRNSRATLQTNLVYKRQAIDFREKKMFSIAVNFLKRSILRVIFNVLYILISNMTSQKMFAGRKWPTGRMFPRPGLGDVILRRIYSEKKLLKR